MTTSRTNWLNRHSFALFTVFDNDQSLTVTPAAGLAVVDGQSQISCGPGLVRNLPFPVGY
jgi:hypothetical protein